jgi:calpain-7
LQYDNGVFWLDFESAVKNFAVIHMSWNPNLFIYKSIVHERWEERDRPISGSDHYNMNYNPQYWLTVSGTGSVWIMLTKHVTSIQTRNDDFVTCHIYGGANGYYGNTNTQPIVPNHRIFYNEKPIIKGRYSNDPHYRAVMEVKGPSVFKLVISQYKEIKNICYTLKVYGTVPCELKEIPRKYQFSVSSNGQWDHFTGGGNSSLPTYRSNPQYRLDFASGGMTNLRFMLDTPTPDLYVNVSVFRNNGEKIQLATTDKVVGTSGNYRNCCACLDIDNFVINSPLTVVVSTFNANQDGSFFLTVESSNTGIKMAQLS